MDTVHLQKQLQMYIRTKGLSVIARLHCIGIITHNVIKKCLKSQLIWVWLKIGIYLYMHMLNVWNGIRIHFSNYLSSQYCRYYIRIPVRIHKVSGPIVDINPDPDESRFHFIFAMSWRRIFSSARLVDGTSKFYFPKVPIG